MNTLAAHLLALADAITPDAAVCRFLETHPNRTAVSLEIGRAVAALTRASAEAEKTAPDPIPADHPARAALAADMPPAPVGSAFYAVRGSGDLWEFAVDAAGAHWGPLAEAHRFPTFEAAMEAAAPCRGYASRAA